MSNTIMRISSGDAIQIRTGVIQGIGPQGPIGPSGPRGETGPQGAQGPIGPAGSVTDYALYATRSASGVGATTVTSNYPSSWTNLSFDNVVHDDLNAVKSSVNFQFEAGRDYAVSLNARFFKSTGNGSGFRGVQAVYNGAIMSEVIVPAVTLVDTALVLTFGFRCTNAGHVMNFKVAHNESTSINVSGRLWINATGPGVAGPQGATGPAGPIGPPGVQGPIGPPGSLIDNTTTIAAIGGTNP